MIIVTWTLCLLKLITKECDEGGVIRVKWNRTMMVVVTPKKKTKKKGGSINCCVGAVMMKLIMECSKIHMTFAIQSKNCFNEKKYL
jgi:hypothetical protein